MHCRNVTVKNIIKANLFSFQKAITCLFLFIIIVVEVTTSVYKM